MKERLRRAISMGLALAMTLSLFSVGSFSWAAKAAEELSPRADSSVDAGEASQKPKLYIDFLGDDQMAYTGINSGASVPSDKDQSYEQKDSGGDPNGPWHRYGPSGTVSADYTPTVPGTVFWVGVGIDKMTAFELAKDGKGLTSLELGFYYNTDYVVPYVGGNASNVGTYDYKNASAYQNILEEKNLAGAGRDQINQWDSGVYHIEEAIPSRRCVVEETTQEYVSFPTNETLTGVNSRWEMLYVSLEKNEDAWGSANRFSDAGALDDSTTYYVMMLPFVLKDYDPNDQICFRLSRNASLFSMGGGEYGAGTYDSDNSETSFGAWERETRTPDHNLKEMFNFEGDLNIFTGRNENNPHDLFSATLLLPGQNNIPENTAKLSVSSEPTTYVDSHGAVLGGLTAGTRLTLEVTTRSDVTASIRIEDANGELSYEPVTEGATEGPYTFVMPAGNVSVTVQYFTHIDDAGDYNAKLVLEDPDGMAGNTAKMTGKDKDDVEHSVSTSGDAIRVKPGDPLDSDDRVTLHVETHPDYEATVSIVTLSNGVVAKDGPDTDGNYSFIMPAADVVVTVTYTKRASYIAELSVDENLTDGSVDNLARLSFTDYSITPETKRSVSLDGRVGGHQNLGPIPTERKVTLDVALATGYTVVDVQLYDKVEGPGGSSEYVFNRSLLPLESITAPQPGESYDRTLSFLMPDNNVQVYVKFAKAEDHKAKLVLVDGANAEMWGYSKTGTRNETDMRATPKVDTIDVQTGNQVTVTLDPDTGYKVKSVQVTSDSIIQPTVNFNWDTDTDLVTFTMPEANVTVTVTFEEIPRETYSATLELDPGDETAHYRNSTGWPRDPGAAFDRDDPPPMDYPTKDNNYAGDRLTAWVDVRPGWYISSFRVEGRDGRATGTGTGSGNAYPLLSMSGNGYNNGQGGQVVLEVEQPAEHITVHLELKKGPPPVEPEQNLTLRVEDPENTETPAANNWAQVSVGGGTAVPTPPVTKDGSYTVQPTTAGDQVEVTFEADTGFYVSDVKVTPENLGIVPDWTVNGDGKPCVQFPQPAGTATVTVYFAKKDVDNPPLQATLHIVDAKTGETATLTTGNTDVTPNSTSVDSGVLGAWPGDQFTTSVVTTRYVTVEVFRGGSVVPWEGTDGNGRFTMPAGNVDVWVTFSDTPPVGNSLTLTAYGLDGEAEGVAGSASLEVDGAVVPGSPALSNDARGVPAVRTRAREDQTVVVKALPQTGYVVDRIAYTPAGAVSPIELAAPAGVGSRAVQFAMPNDATGVEVYFRKGEAQKYMANITLWPPTGVSTSDVGDARFTENGAYSISAAAGTPLNVEAYAKDGYYISKIEITPRDLGIASPITGVFASQTVDFVMPAANCTVNVYFSEGWPSSADLNATLNVHGPSTIVSTAILKDTTAPRTAETSPVAVKGSESLFPAWEQDKMTVELNIDSGESVDSITVRDANGVDVPYRWSGPSQISFDMPASHATVDVTYKEGPDTTNWKATLHYDDPAMDNGTAVLTDGANSATNDGESITGLHAGNRLDLTVTPPAGRTAAAVVVPQSGGPVLTLDLTGNADHFFMQNEDVDVFITYPSVLDPDQEEYLATLVATEVSGTSNAGEAKMEEGANSAGPIQTVNMAAMPAVAENTVTITATPAAGYVVDSVKVNDGAVEVRQTGPNTYTYTMPHENVTAIVTFAPDPGNTLKAQIVVDNGGNTGNRALLRRASEAPAAGTTLLSPLSANDQVYVDLTVAAGYRVELVKVTPEAYGVSVEPLDLPDTVSQSTYFRMPPHNVVVFVRFVRDDSEQYNINMTVKEDPDPTPGAVNQVNTATLHTNISGDKGPVKAGEPTVTAKGRVNDVVTITTTVDTDRYWVEVVETSGPSVVDLTTLPDGTTFTFSVPNNNVDVDVIFHDKSVTPVPTPKVRLHIFNPQFGDLANTYAGEKSTLSTATPNKTCAEATPQILEIEVPYLQTVEVGSQALANCYVQSAYAMVNGVLLPPISGTSVDTPPAGTPFTGFTARGFDFLMQNRDVDVYVYFTDQLPPGPLTASLVVTGPTGEAVGAAGSAVLANTTKGLQTGQVDSNKTFDPAADAVAASQGDEITVTVTVNPNYSIDRVVAEPLSLDLVPTSETTLATGETVYTYTMPAADMNVHVLLKKDTEGHKVTLHLTDHCTDDPSVNSADVAYTVYHLTQDGEQMEVPTGQKVGVKVTAGVDASSKQYYVHHAYAVVHTDNTDPAQGPVNGTVLPLTDFNPNTIHKLQDLGYTGSTESSGSALFEMPDADVDVYIEFRAVDDTENPHTGELSAVVTVSDPTNSGSSSAELKLERGSDTYTTSAVSDNVTSAPLSVNAGETVSLNLTIAPGYEVETITLTGGVPIPTLTPVDETHYTFEMPNYDLGVIVKLKTMETKKYTATLHIVDHSSALGNAAAMQERGGATMVDTDGGQLTDLLGTTTISTTATPRTGVAVRAVIATDSTGTHILSEAAGTYDYIMQNADVDITVVFDNDDAPNTPEMYLAIVTKEGDGTDLAGNSAAIANTTNPALPHGEIWTGIYGEDPQQLLQVDVGTETGYYAVITATTKDNGSGTVTIPVTQLGTTGSITGYVSVPTDLVNHVTIIVTYSTTPPADLSHSLTLTLNDPVSNAGNQAAIIDNGNPGDTAVNLSVDGVTSTSTQNGVAAGTGLELSTTVIVGVYEEKRELTANGITLALPASGAFVMPLSDAEVTVTLMEGMRTPRPHDSRQDPMFSGTNGTGYIDGYLKGENLGGNQAKIQVPNLYQGGNLSAAYDPSIDYDYKLYLKDGGTYHLLEPLVDYDKTAFESYAPGAPNEISGASRPDTGWEFWIRSLKGESALTELLLNGGVLYITATDKTTPRDESEYVEVVLPADPNKGKYQATLRIVDNSGVEGNEARMSDGTTTVSTDGAVIENLQGNELIRTVVTPASGARVSAVTVTDSGGTRLLDRVPEDLQRYPYYMLGENITITVYFEAPEDDDLTRYIAAVSKHGAIGVPGNEATIQNDTRSDLSKGDIWAEGHESNVMRVTVDVANGYYATLTATNKKDGSEVDLTVFGAGPGVTTFDSIFTMPAADVQVDVVFTTTPPDNLFNDLTLRVVNHGDVADNQATLTKQTTLSDPSPLVLAVFGSATATDTEQTANNVAAGTRFELTTGHDSAYYVKEARALVYDEGGALLSTLTIGLDTAGVGSFTMPLGAATVEVEFTQVPRTARPYDPDHSETYNSPAYVAGSPADLSDPTQEGWIQAQDEAPLNGLNRVKVLIPTLHDDENTDPATALSPAGDDTQPNGAAADYKFYWRDSFGTYHPLVVGTDVDITGRFVDDAYSPYDGCELTLTAKRAGNLLDYYIKNGGTIYVTATQTPKEESDYTQVVISKAYTATLKYEPHGDVATMSIPDHPDVDRDGGQTTGLRGTETITVKNIHADNGYVVTGVVVTTQSGSTVPAVRQDDGSYTYEMDHADVTLQVVFAAVEDPWEPAGRHIVTVYKEGDDGLPRNDATVTDVDVPIPPEEQGRIWTVAYGGNTVRVDVTTDPDYYAEITAKKATDDSDVSVAPFIDSATGQLYGLLSMLPDSDVKVTVKYIKGTPPDRELTLKVVDADGLAENTAEVAKSDGATPPTFTTILSANGDDPTQAGPEVVAPGAELTLTTASAPNHSVQSAEMVVNGISIPIPLTDGVSLPLPVMPMANAEIIVTFQDQDKPLMPRPYDPMHSETYNGTADGGDYAHGSTTGDHPDWSQTHQEGWILATNVNTEGDDTGDGTGESFDIRVPTLHDKVGGTDTLHNAVENYNLYWKDSMGIFQKLEVGRDIEITGGAPVTDAYQNAALTPPDYDGYQFTVSILKDTSNTVDPTYPTYPTLWGGYTLRQYLQDGGSIWITALDGADPATAMESEKTEVVIRIDEDLRPYDPNTLNGGTPTPYEDHWITSENRGDSLIVTIPILNTDDGTQPTSIDKDVHTFHFYLVPDASGPASGWSYESLENVITLTHPDPDNTTDRYENDSYYEDGGVQYTGARFILTVKTDSEIDDLGLASTDADAAKDQAKMLRALMDNNGTTKAIEDGVDWNNSGTPTNYRLYVTHQDDTGFESRYVDFEIPRYYAFQGILESYAPKHDATFTLYPLKTADPGAGFTPDYTQDSDYEEEPFLTYTLTQSWGTDLWEQDFKLRSSKLMGDDGTGMVYKLKVEKPGHVTYIWMGVELAPVTLDDPADADCLTFTLDPDVNGGMIALIGGDIDDNGVSGLEDLELMTDFMSGERDWSRVKDDTDPGAWAISTYNPDSLAYAADLDGNGKIGAPDLAILNSKRNFRQRAACYQDVMPQLIHGSDGPVTGANGGVILYSLMEEEILLPEWAETLLAAGGTIPNWAMERLTAGLELPLWAQEMIQDEKTIPGWAAELVKAEKTLPDWAEELAKVEVALPDWAKEMAGAEKTLPDWAKEMVLTEKTMPVWAQELLQAEKMIPDWARELAQAGEELPEEMADLLAAGEELPQELPQETPPAPPVNELPAPSIPEQPAEGATEQPEVPGGTEGAEVPGGETPDVPENADGEQGDPDKKDPGDNTQTPTDPAEDGDSENDPPEDEEQNENKDPDKNDGQEKDQGQTGDTSQEDQTDQKDQDESTDETENKDEGENQGQDSDGSDSQDGKDSPSSPDGEQESGADQEEPGDAVQDQGSSDPSDAQETPGSSETDGEFSGTGEKSDPLAEETLLP